MGRRIGLLGGTFDPPHLGHLWMAEMAREQLALDRVLFLPVGTPPHKEGYPVTAVNHRLEMVRRAVADNPYFDLDPIDAEREPPHHTISLLPLMRRAYPQARFWFLVGADSMADLPNWKRPADIIKQCQLAVCPRPGVTIDWPTLKTAVPGIETAVDFLGGPALAVSSTVIRRWRRAGHSVRYLVPAPLLDYLDEERLYRETAD